MRQKNSRSEQCRCNNTQISPNSLQSQLSIHLTSFQELKVHFRAKNDSSPRRTSPAPYPCDIEADDGSRMSWHSHHTHPLYTENVHKYSAMSKNAQKITEIRKRMRKNVQNQQKNSQIIENEEKEFAKRTMSTQRHSDESKDTANAAFKSVSILSRMVNCFDSNQRLISAYNFSRTIPLRY